MLAALRQALPDLLASYGSAQAVLDQKLAYVVRCPPAHVVALNGASQAFPILRELLHGRSLLVPSPTFGEYERMFPAAARYADAPGVDLTEIERRADAHDVVVLVSPNSPTGTTLSTAWLHALAARTPGTLFLVDESFVDFSAEEPLVRRLVREPLPNVVVLMSLSKTLGVPGLRLGYLYSSDPAWKSQVVERLPIWNLNAPAEFFLELLLKYRAELEASLARTVADRDAFGRDLRQLPLVNAVFPSGGNFLLVRLHGDAATASHVRERLLAERGIDVKDVSSRFPGGAFLRVAVRRPDDNARFLSAMAGLAQV